MAPSAFPPLQPRQPDVQPAQQPTRGKALKASGAQNRKRKQLQDKEDAKARGSLENFLKGKGMHGKYHSVYLNFKPSLLLIYNLLGGSVHSSCLIV